MREGMTSMVLTTESGQITLDNLVLHFIGVPVREFRLCRPS